MKNLNEFRNYSVEDWIEDPDFRAWVFRYSAASSWMDRVFETPEHHANMEQARHILLSVKGDGREMGRFEAKEEVGRIMVRVGERESAAPVFDRVRRNWRWLAASVLVVTGLAGLWRIGAPVSEERALPGINPAEATSARYRSVVNKGSKPMPVLLPDGSRVTLESSSEISFLQKFEGIKREVYLKGRAFFEVTKQPDRPFLVYADDLVTKVLGTSFEVIAYEGQDKIQVKVKTGRVTVFQNNEQRGGRKGQASAELLLTPNQQVIYERTRAELVRSVIDEPDLLVVPEGNSRFEFKRAPLKEVFNTLEDAYGVDILYDDELLRNCTLTAVLGEEPLFDKLAMICDVLGCSYEKIDGYILVRGNGCN